MVHKCWLTLRHKRWHENCQEYCQGVVDFFKMPASRKTCIEQGCHNALTDGDRKRFPEFLSRPLPPEQQTVYKSEIERLNMRLRCSRCWMEKYHDQYFAISYRWAYGNRQNSQWRVNVHDEPTTEEDEKKGRKRQSKAELITSDVPIPIANRAQREVMMDCPLFFMDVIDAPSGSRQWETSNLVKTYASSGGVIALLNTSDRRILEENREFSIHQALENRDRNSYLGTPYGQQERMAAYSRVLPEKITFINTGGINMGNIERSGWVRSSDNALDRIRSRGGSFLPEAGGNNNNNNNNTRSPASQISRMVQIASKRERAAARKRNSNNQLPAQNQDRIRDQFGNLPMPTPAYDNYPVSSLSAGDINVSTLTSSATNFPQHDLLSTDSVGSGLDAFASQLNTDDLDPTSSLSSDFSLMNLNHQQVVDPTLSAQQARRRRTKALER